MKNGHGLQGIRRNGPVAPGAVEADLRAYKARLLNHALHALATPLTPALLRVRVLMDTAQERQRAGLEALREELDEMRRILQDLATIAQMDAGALPMARVRVDLRQLLTEASADARARVQVPSRGAVQLGDPDRLREAFSLLIGRVLQATQDEVPVVLRQRGGAWLRIGAAATPRPADPLPLWDVDGAPAGRLALYLADAVVTRHGGTAWVQSHDPLTFGVHLPRGAC